MSGGKAWGKAWGKDLGAELLASANAWAQVLPRGVLAGTPTARG